MKGKILLITLLLSFIPLQVLAQSAVIGQDDTFIITPIVFLNTGTPEADVFNYFFTLELFCGMIALFVRLFLKLLKL